MKDDNLVIIICHHKDATQIFFFLLCKQNLFINTCFVLKDRSAVWMLWATINILENKTLSIKLQHKTPALQLKTVKTSDKVACTVRSIFYVRPSIVARFVCCTTRSSISARNIVFSIVSFALQDGRWFSILAEFFLPFLFNFKFFFFF